MKIEDQEKFAQVLLSCGEIYSKEVRDGQIALFWEAVKDIPLDKITQAFTKHIKTSRFFPTPAEILGYIPSAQFSGHIGADEAWTLALKAMDENATVILNEEILKAREMAMDIYYSGDKVGARMAFKGAYQNAILGNEKPKWFVSLGHDKNSREGEIAKAYDAGLISYEQVVKYLPSTTIQDTDAKQITKT